MDKLQIETYIETQEAPKDKQEVDQYNEALLNLGLDHLLIKDEKISPIAPMSDLEIAVYKVLCPSQDDIKNYGHPIPLRVLEAYAKCKDYLEDFCAKKSDKLTIEIWTDKDPDPVMIAKAGYREKFIIGRWGKELQDFPTLLKRAKERSLSKSRKEIEEARNIVKLYDEDKDAFAMGIIAGNISNIYF